MKTIKCNAITHDRYPAGLYLASSLWEALEQINDPDLDLSCICSFWDGVKLEGLYYRRQFWIEINYANENIVLLVIRAKKRILESQKAQDNFEEGLMALFEKSIEQLGNRHLIKDH